MSTKFTKDNIKFNDGGSQLTLDVIRDDGVQGFNGMYVVARHPLLVKRVDVELNTRQVKELSDFLLQILGEVNNVKETS